MNPSKALCAALVSFGLVLSACSGSETRPPTPTTTAVSVDVSPTPVAPTATPKPVTLVSAKPYPPGTRTGNADIDPVLAAIEAGTPAALRDVVRYVSAPCVFPRPPGLGAIAVCPDGVAPGTPVEVFPAAPGEGVYIPRTDFESNPRLPGVGMALYAVVRQSRPTTEPGWPQGDYVLYFGGGNGFFSQLFVADGKAVLACWICGVPNEDLKQPTVQFILPLRP